MNLLTGPHIRLRAVEPADVETILSFENDPDIWMVSNTITPYSRFEIEEYVLNARRDIFATRQLRLMIDPVSDRMQYNPIGTIDLFDFEPIHLRAGIGIMIAAASRNQGFAREAMNLLLPYCRDVLLLHQVYANIAATNTVSIRLFESLGFALAGTKTDWINTGDGWITEYLYQRIF